MKITLQDNPPAPTDVQAVEQILAAYNTRHVGPPQRQSLVLLLQDESGQLVGGLNGNTGGGWLYVAILAIADHARGQDWGTKLLAAAEREAIARGCHSAYLDTFDFQALPFYQKQGFTLFGALDHFYGQHQRYFLQKKFA